jgi:hypothetical protein
MLIREEIQERRSIKSMKVRGEKFEIPSFFNNHIP